MPESYLELARSSSDLASSKFAVLLNDFGTFVARTYINVVCCFLACCLPIVDGGPSLPVPLSPLRRTYLDSPLAAHAFCLLCSLFEAAISYSLCGDTNSSCSSIWPRHIRAVLLPLSLSLSLSFALSPSCALTVGVKRASRCASRLIRIRQRSVSHLRSSNDPRDC